MGLLLMSFSPGQIDSLHSPSIPELPREAPLSTPASPWPAAATPLWALLVSGWTVPAALEPQHLPLQHVCFRARPVDWTYMTCV